MANTHDSLTSLFTDIADSIRAKTGENRVLIADDFPDEIDAIPSGGGGEGGQENPDSKLDNYTPLKIDYIHKGYYNCTKSGGNVPNFNDATLSPRYFCTPILSRSDIPVGSIIYVKSGFKYRPDAWVDTSTPISSGIRPAITSTECVTVTEEWWGDFNYRGFNIMHKDGTTEMSDTDFASADRNEIFCIYIPKVN